MDEPSFPTEPFLDALDIESLTQEGYRDSGKPVVLRALDQVRRSGGSYGAADFPKIVFLYGSDYEKLWTAHGVFLLDGRLGKWYWVNQELPLQELCRRFPLYAEYALDRTRRQIASYENELRFDLRPSDRSHFETLAAMLQAELDACAESTRLDNELPR